jgi:hypothetical protein
MKIKLDDRFIIEVGEYYEDYCWEVIDSQTKLFYHPSESNFQLSVLSWIEQQRQKYPTVTKGADD